MLQGTKEKTFVTSISAANTMTTVSVVDEVWGRAFIPGRSYGAVSSVTLAAGRLGLGFRAGVRLAPFLAPDARVLVLAALCFDAARNSS